MKLHPPEKCPFCGKGKVSGGGDRMVYYTCGAHIWVVQADADTVEIRGHNGPCETPVP